MDPGLEHVAGQVQAKDRLQKPEASQPASRWSFHPVTGQINRATRAGNAHERRPGAPPRAPPHTIDLHDKLTRLTRTHVMTKVSLLDLGPTQPGTARTGPRYGGATPCGEHAEWPDWGHGGQTVDKRTETLNFKYLRNTILEQAFANRQSNQRIRSSPYSNNHQLHYLCLKL